MKFTKKMALELYNINSQIASLKKRADELKAIAQAGEYGDIVIGITVTSRSSIDANLLREVYPSIAEEVTRSTEVRTVRVKKV